jgi:hypothetical protein
VSILSVVAAMALLSVLSVVTMAFAEQEEGGGLERVMNLGENRIEMRIPRSVWFPRDLRFPHS